MVDSIMNQTVSEWELIVIDDGSTDKSQELLERYATKDTRIKCHYTRKNQGAAAAFNLGLKKARANVIGRIDSDDALECNAIEIMILKHQMFPDCSLICSHAWECDANLNRIRKWRGYSPPKGKSLLENCSVGHFATFKRNLLPENFALDEKAKRAVDLDLYLRLEEHGNIQFINEPLYLYRKHQSGISQYGSGILAYHWSRYVRLKATKRRKSNGLLFHLSKTETKKLAYEWLVFELRNGEAALTKFQTFQLALSFSPRIALNPKAYLHLLLSP